MKHYKSVEFLSNFNVKPLCTNVKPAIEEFLATVLAPTTNAILTQRQVGW